MAVLVAKLFDELLKRKCSVYRVEVFSLQVLDNSELKLYMLRTRLPCGSRLAPAALLRYARPAAFARQR